MRSTALSARSLSCLQYVQQQGSCTTADLVALQRRLPGGAARTKAAVNGTSYNLHVTGYLRRTVADSSLWELTEKGRLALGERSDRHPPAHPPTQASGRPAEPEMPPHPARAVRYGGRVIYVPIAPRWVFDIGAFLP